MITRQEWQILWPESLQKSHSCEKSEPGKGTLSKLCHRKDSDTGVSGGKQKEKTKKKKKRRGDKKKDHVVIFESV